MPPAPTSAGIGWRAPHEAALLEQRPALGFIEVHSENFFGDGGPALACLQAARAHWPVSLHGVGLGLASAAGLDPWHLERLARLVERVEPWAVSDHASFARAPRTPGGPVIHAADLLPPPRDATTLARLVRHVQQVQERLRRPILVENLSAALAWRDDAMDEAEWLSALARRSGCRLLLDLNNLMVNARNALAGPDGQAAALDDPLVAAAVRTTVDRIPPGLIGELHLAGHTVHQGLALDDHGSAVAEPAWALLAHTLRRHGPLPVLIEWDTAVPPLDVLLAEARRADAVAAEVASVPAAKMAAVRPADVKAPRAPATGASRSAGLASARTAVRPDGQPAASGAQAHGQTFAVTGSPSPAPSEPTAPAPPASASAQPPDDGPHRSLAAAPSATDDPRPQHLLHALSQPIGSPAAAQVDAALSPWLAGDAAAQSRALAALRGQQRATAVHALRAVYPALRDQLGDEAFAVLARRHALDHPPTRGDLGQWGADLADAIAAEPQLADWPWLADLARLEWAVHRAQHAADAVPMDARGLQALAHVDPATVHLRPPPGATLLTVDGPIDAIWRDSLDHADAADAAPGRSAGLAAADDRDGSAMQTSPATPERVPDAADPAAASADLPAHTLLVWRPAGRWQVRVRRLNGGDTAALAACLAGASLADALAAAFDLDADWDPAALLQAAWIDGLLVVADLS